MQTQTATETNESVETFEDQTRPGVPGEGEPKTPATRVLDMLGGWMEFVQRSSSAEDLAVSPEDVFDLYQDAGGALIRAYASAQEEETVVRGFLEERVLPLLLAGA